MVEFGIGSKVAMSLLVLMRSSSAVPARSQCLPLEPRESCKLNPNSRRETTKEKSKSSKQQQRQAERKDTASSKVGHSE